METLNVKLNGEAALIIQADTLADPLHPLTKIYKATTSKKKKTDADHAEMGRIEFEGGLYIDEKSGPYVPSDYVFKALVEAARMNKEGKDIERGVFITDDQFSIDYDGPRDLKSLSENRTFHYRKTVVIGKSRTVRERPIFRLPWSLNVSLTFDEAIVNRAVIIAALNRAGNYIGIGNRRPNKGGNFGRFSVQVQ